MNESFQKTLVVCAAASCFGSGAYVVVNGVDSLIAQRVEAMRIAEEKPSLVDQMVESVANGINGRSKR